MLVFHRIKIELIFITLKKSFKNYLKFIAIKKSLSEKSLWNFFIVLTTFFLKVKFPSFPSITPPMSLKEMSFSVVFLFFLNVISPTDIYRCCPILFSSQLNSYCNFHTKWIPMSYRIPFNASHKKTKWRRRNWILSACVAISWWFLPKARALNANQIA